VIQLTDQRHDRNLPQDGPVPVALNGNSKLAALLRNPYLLRVVAVALQVDEIRRVDISACRGEVALLPVGQLKLRQLDNGGLQRNRETGREHMLPPVDEVVPRPSLRKKLHHRMLHGEFIEVVIQYGADGHHFTACSQASAINRAPASVVCTPSPVQ